MRRNIFNDIALGLTRKVVVDIMCDVLDVKAMNRNPGGNMDESLGIIEGICISFQVTAPI